MTLYDLPRWMLNWLLPWLPWLWVVVTTLGLALWLVAGRRRRTRVPTCPVCRYDMRGSPGLTCPECGHTVQQADQLLERPRRRWAVVLGVLMIVGGPYIDLIQYRLQERETIPQAIMPNTFWIVGYPWFPTAANEAIEVRIKRWELRLYRDSGFGSGLPPRSDILRWVYGQDPTRARDHLPVTDWQIRLLARHSQRWLLDQLAAGHNSMRHSYRPYYYLHLSETHTDDAYAREQIIAGLTNSDSNIWSTCYKIVSDFQDRAAPYVPCLSRLLRQEITGWRQVSTFSPVGRYPSRQELLIDRSESLGSLEKAIGRSGEPGVEVASRWLMEDDERLRRSATRILSYADVPYHLSQPLADRVVDQLITMNKNSQYHHFIGHLGLSAVNRSRFYLHAGSYKPRFTALQLLGSIYFDGPESRIDRAVHFGNGSRQDLIEEWIARVDDPSYQQALNDITPIASDDPEELIRRRAQRFMEYHGLLGTAALRRELYRHPTKQGWHYQHNYFY